MTTPKFVVDTSALAAIALDELGATRAQTYIEDGACVIHEVNVSELCFTLPRKRPTEFDPVFTRAWVKHLGLYVMSGFSDNLGYLAADIRLQNHALNLGDGVAVATAYLLNVPVLTAEKAFAKSSMFVKVELIR